MLGRKLDMITPTPEIEGGWRANARCENFQTLKIECQ